MTGIDHLANRNSRAGSRRGGRPTKLGMELLEPRCMLSVNVTTWHNDLTRQGLNTNETVLTPANVNSGTFGKLFSYAVTGQVYAEPLYASNLNMGALGTHNVVFVATQNNDVYAFDAVNNGAGGGQLWHVNLNSLLDIAEPLPPGMHHLAAAVPNIYFGNTGWDGVNPPNGNYGDITPQVGITSTPVIDLATNTMFIDAFSNDGTGLYSHHIWALDITTGAQKMAPKLVAASISGNSPADSVGGTITFVAKQQIQRAAMTLLNGTVYVAYAGYGDFPPYHGWILGFDASNLNLTKVFNDTPNATVPEDPREQGAGGIWQAGGGLVSDGTHLYFMTGNGDFDASVGDYGDSFVELTPDNSIQTGPNPNKNGYGLSVTDYFAPYDEQTLSNNDTDLGSAAPLLLPDQPGAHPHELVGAGKGLKMYVVDRDSMGGHIISATGPDTNIVQTVSVNRAPGSQAYYNNLIFFHGYNSALLKAYQLQSDGTLSAAAVASGSVSIQFPGATPAISAYGNSANGIVWETQYSTTTAVLRAYNAVPNGSALTELYNSGSALGAGVKFTVPTVADGHVYVGSSGALTVFGLTSNPSTAPSAPSSLTATASAVPSFQVQLNWTDNANNENAFKIERSTDGMNFTQIAITSVNSTSYADSAVVSGTTYYYRVRATNPIGDSSPASAGPVTPVVTPPVIQYGFDEGTGTFAADSGSGGTNTGVLVGATKPAWVAGRTGAGALSFNGNGAYNQTNQSAVQVSSNLIAPLGTTSTLAAWVKTTQTGSNNHQQAPAITGVDQQGTTSDINWGTLNASGQIGIYVGDSGGVYSTSPINDGQWHHVAMTRDATTGQVQLYVDGVLNGSSTLAAAAGTKAAQFYLIGALTDRNGLGYVTGANYFNGQLDDVRIYNRVLSASEISQIGAAPSAAAGLSASAIPDTSSMVQLSWTNTSEVAQNISVERKTGDNGTYEPIATLAGTETKYFDTNLEPGTEYSYRVQAVAPAGASEYSNESSAVTLTTQVVGRFVFYNQSKFDGSNGSSNIVDTPALATDKQALLPGQTATFQNYTTYSKGINGIMIDLANFEGSITPDDFEVMVGNSNDLSSWQPAPELDFAAEYVGWGVGGSIRVEIGWENNEIQNEWVQVTLKANENTGLAEDDVFYFGNSIGDTGNSPTNAIVDASDVLAIQNNHTAAATITNPYDLNRDKIVDETDEMIAQTHFSGSSPLQMITLHGGGGGGGGLENNNLSPAGNSTVDAGGEIALIESPVTTDTSTVTPRKLLFGTVVMPKLSDRASSVDAVFADHEIAPIRVDFAASLLNLTSIRQSNRQRPLDGTVARHSRPHDSSYNDTDSASDELVADEFTHVQTYLNLRSSLKRR